MKTNGRIWVAMAGLFALGAGTLSAACLGDLRLAVVKRTPTDASVEVRLVRAYGDGSAENPEPLPIRADARDVRVGVSRVPVGTATNLVALLDGDCSSWAGIERGKGGFALPAVAAGETLLVCAEFKVPAEFPGGLWWVSYVPVDPAARDIRFRLDLPKGEKPAVRMGGEWVRTNRESGEREIIEWAPVRGKVGGFLMAGSATSWEVVGRGMLKAFRSRDSGAEGALLPRELAELKRIEGDSQRLERAMELIGAMGKRPASTGLAAGAVRDTIQENAGNCKDLSLLMVKVVQSLEMSPYVVFRATGLDTLDGLPACPYVFDHVMVGAPVAGSMWCFDLTTGKKFVENVFPADGEVQRRGNLMLVKVE
jgi:hypothetical protein